MSKLIREYLQGIVELTKRAPMQQPYYKQQLEDLKPIKLSKLSDVFTNEIIKSIIKDTIQPEPKMCYRNATLLTQWFPDLVQYCEGYIEVQGVVLEHAFNKVGDHYVDITAEIALEEDPTNKTYGLLASYSWNEIERQMFATEVYGGVYEFYYKERLKLESTRIEPYSL